MANKEREIWDDIRTEYVTSDIPLNALAEQFKVCYGTLKNKCADNHWTDARRTYRENEIKADEARRKLSASKEKGAFDDSLIRIAKLSVLKSAVMMTDLTVKDAEGNATGILIDTKTVKESLAIAKEAQDILYRVWDVPSAVNRVADVTPDKSPAETVDDDMSHMLEDAANQKLKQMIDCAFAPPSGNGNGNGNGSADGNGESQVDDGNDS